MIIGIQGSEGSTNERACVEFCKKRNIRDCKIKYLIATKNVLKELNQNKISLGVFAFKSSKGGLVEETQMAIKNYPFKKIDEIDLKVVHVLLGIKKLNKTEYNKIVSHPQALKEHKEYIRKNYSNIELIKADDTALSAQKLKEHKYGHKTLVIAPKACAKIYGLNIIEENLLANKEYFTTFYLVKKPSASK